MAKMTRRAMLWATSASVAAATGVAALIAGQKIESASAAPATSEFAVKGPITAYIADTKSGKISLLVGEQEIIVNNPALVQEILNAIH